MPFCVPSCATDVLGLVLGGLVIDSESWQRGLLLHRRDELLKGRLASDALTLVPAFHSNTPGWSLYLFDFGWGDLCNVRVQRKSHRLGKSCDLAEVLRILVGLKSVNPPSLMFNDLSRHISLVLDAFDCLLKLPNLFLFPFDLASHLKHLRLSLLTAHKHVSSFERLEELVRRPVPLSLFEVPQFHLKLYVLVVKFDLILQCLTEEFFDRPLLAAELLVLSEQGLHR